MLQQWYLYSAQHVTTCDGVCCNSYSFLIYNCWLCGHFDGNCSRGYALLQGWCTYWCPGFWTSCTYANCAPTCIANGGGGGEVVTKDRQHQSTEPYFVKSTILPFSCRTTLHFIIPNKATNSGLIYRYVYPHLVTGQHIRTPPRLELREIFPGVKRPGREADHSPPSGAEVKNGGAMHPLTHVFMAQCLIKQAQGLYLLTIGRILPCFNVYHWFLRHHFLQNCHCRGCSNFFHYISDL
jgi:hypothetical protein